MEFMKKVEEISKKIGETASDTYNVVADKSGKFIQDTKSKFAISEKERKIQEIFEGIGRTVYEMYLKGEDVGEVFKQEAEKVDDFKKEIREINKKILANKGLKECNNCGKVIQMESKFCQHCGVEQPQIEVVETKPEEQPEGNICSKCNTKCEDDAEFCPNCGEKLD